jgi:hypothetical protein
MSTDRDVTRIVRSWLRTDENESADRVLDAVLDRIDTTAQSRATSWPARRYSDMTSMQRLTVMAAAAAVLLVLAYGVWARPNVGQDAEPTPSPSAAASDPEPRDAAITSPPVEFTACVPQNSPIRTGTNEQIALPSPEGDVTVDLQRGFTWRGTITATDDRLSGTHYYSWDADAYALPGGGTPTSWAEGHRIENDEGAWQGSSVGFTDADDVSVGGAAVLIGEGAYEGLTAIIATSIEGGCFLNFRGFVISVPATRAPDTEG